MTHSPSGVPWIQEHVAIAAFAAEAAEEAPRARQMGGYHACDLWDG